MNVKKQTIDGVKWVALGQAIRFPIQIVVSIGIARFINPDSFGLIGMVFVLTNFASIFSDLGFGSAIVQKKEINNDLLSSVFWINVGVGFLLCLMFISLSYPISLFYGQPELRLLTIVVSFSFIINALSSVPSSLLNRQLEFKTLVARDLLSLFFGSVAGLSAAFFLRNEWALVIQMYITTVVSTFALWAATKWRPTFKLDSKEIGSVWSYGSNLTGYTLFNYFSRNFDDLLVGKFLGAASLGIYSKGYSYVTLPLTQVTGILAKVMFPALSKIHEDKERFKIIYVKVCRCIALFVFPSMAGLFVVAEPFVYLFLGKEWEELIPIIKVFSLLGILQCISNTVGWIYTTTGKTDMMFKWGVVSSLIVVCSFIIGIVIGDLQAMVISYAITSGFILFFPCLYFPFKLIDLSVFDFLIKLMPVGLATLFMVACTLGVPYIFAIDESMRVFMIQIIVGVVSYVAWLKTFSIEAYLEVLALVRAQFKEKKEVIA